MRHFLNYLHDMDCFIISQLLEFNLIIRSCCIALSLTSSLVMLPMQDLEAKLKQYSAELAKIAARQAELKGSLCGRFGKNINFED